ncbi:MAG: hypothetical protein LBF16_08560, partial [Pseudomonadales bacterium]|nr:hypothetical protein [Pseudomonadales bacterium]
MKMLSLLAAVMLSLCSVPCVTFAATLDFGDDTSGQAHNGKCDDPRFSGPGSAAVLIEQNAYRDASDCRDLYQRGQIQTANGKSARSTPGAVNAKSRSFGDDASRWARNGECDDPRFSGPGAARKLAQVDRFHAATDCSSLYRSGGIRLASGAVGAGD